MYTLGFFWAGASLLALCVFASALGMALARHLLARRHALPGKLLLTLSYNLPIPAFCLALGPESRSELYFFPAVLLPFLLFRHRDRLWIILGMLLPAILMVWVEAVSPLSLGAFSRQDALVLWLAKTSAPATTFLLLWIIGAAFLVENEKAAAASLRQFHDLAEERSALIKAMTETKAAADKALALMRHSPVATYELDISGQCVGANPKWSELTGLPESAALGEGWKEAVHPHDRDWLFSAAEILIGQGLELDFEYRIRSLQGHAIWVRGSAVVLRNSAGEVTGYLGTMQDIDKDKQGQLRLQAEGRREAMMSRLRGILLNADGRAASEEILAVLKTHFKAARAGLATVRSDEGAAHALESRADGVHRPATIPRAEWRGVWGRLLERGVLFLQNTPVEDALPGGRAANFLAAPLLMGTQSIGYIALADKDGGFDDADEEDLADLCLVLAPAFDGRLQAEMLEEARSHYENELLQAMEEARSNSERFRALVDSLPDMVLRLSAEGILLDLKTQNPEDLPSPAADWIGRPFSDLQWPQEFSDAVSAASALQGGGTRAAEFSREGALGRQHFEARLVRMGSHEIVAYIRNVTSRKKLEEQQRANLEFLKNLNRELSDQRFALDRHAIVAVTDLKGSLTYVNDLKCKVSGYSRDELLGQTHALVDSGYHPDEFFRDMWKTISAGRVWQGEIRNRRKDGTFYWVSTTIVPFREASGKPKQFMAISNDITALKEAETAIRKHADALKLQNLELEEARDLALASTRAKSEFLATMSHEIRTPMNGVLGMTGLLLDTDLSSLQREYGLTIQQSAESLLSIINDILDFSKIEAGKLDIEPIPFWLEGCCQEVCDLLAFRAEQAGVKLMLRLQPGIPKMLVGDPGRLRQILLNLAGNAIKFTQQGHVLIEVGCTSLLGEGKYEFFFAVQDSGIGLSPEAKGRLFQPFSQADASTTRKFGGTGLGLAICKRLVEIMEGEIGVESEIGVGSTFWFRIALPPAPEPDWTPVATIDLSGVRALVVDDHAIDAQISLDVLTGLGLRVECAVDGEDGLAAILQADAAGDPYEIALVDWTMPRLDGEGLALALQSRALASSPSLIMLTAAANRGDAHRMKQAGFTGFLVKPTGAELLVKVVREAYRRRRLGTGKGELITRHSVTEADAVRSAVRKDAALDARVLLVEDNAVNQKVAAQILKKLGCRVEVAANGAEGLSMVKALPFDIVLMDCQMPEMDGFEATRRIREWEKMGRGHVPIVAMTANAMQGDRERCLEAGMDDYLSKPIKATLLRETLVKNLEPAELRAHEVRPGATS